MVLDLLAFLVPYVFSDARDQLGQRDEDNVATNKPKPDKYQRNN